MRVLSRRFLFFLTYYRWLFVDQSPRKRKKRSTMLEGKSLKQIEGKTDHFYCEILLVSYVTRNGIISHEFTWTDDITWWNDDPKSTIDSPQQFIFLLLKQILNFHIFTFPSIQTTSYFHTVINIIKQNGKYIQLNT